MPGDNLSEIEIRIYKTKLLTGAKNAPDIYLKFSLNARRSRG